MFGQLKPLNERKLSIDEVIARIRKATSKVPGAMLFFQANQDLSVGGRGSAEPSIDQNATFCGRTGRVSRYPVSRLVDVLI